jgi:hypothetical protein
MLDVPESHLIEEGKVIGGNVHYAIVVNLSRHFNQ